MNKFFFRKYLKVFFFIVLTGFLLFFQKNIIFAAEERFYTVRIVYNLSFDKLSLGGDNSFPSVTVDKYNFTYDTGSGSQFYAQVVDLNNQTKAVNDRDKFFLGQWDKPRLFWDGIDESGNFTGGSLELEEGEVKVSIPYFSDGKTINIYQTSSDELVLSVDVSLFAMDEPDDAERMGQEKGDGLKNLSDTEEIVSKGEVGHWARIIFLSVLIVIALLFGIAVYKRRRLEP